MYLPDILSTQVKHHPDIMAPMSTSINILLVRVRVYKSLHTVTYFIHISVW